MNVITADKFYPTRDKVFITDMKFSEHVTKSGIIIQSDDGKVEGVKPRWGRVWAIGPEQTDVAVGDWILVEHGRWTRGIPVVDHDGTEITIRLIETKSIMIKSDHCPDDIILGAHAMPSAGVDYDFTQPMFEA